MSKHLLQLLRDNARREGSGIHTLVRDESAVIYLYDVIDPYFGVSAADFTKQLDQLANKKVSLRINSPGGDVFEARAIATAIAQHGNVHAQIDSLAASAATYIVTACASAEISDGAFFMIHNAWTFAYGNKEDLTKTASLLDKVDGTIVADYAKKTGKSEDEITAWMAEETWFTAQEAVDNGFVDKIVLLAYEREAQAPANRGAWNVAAFAKAPKALTAPPKREPLDEKACQVQRAANANRLRLLELTTN